MGDNPVARVQRRGGQPLHLHFHVGIARCEPQEQPVSHRKHLGADRTPDRPTARRREHRNRREMGGGSWLGDFKPDEAADGAGGDKDAQGPKSWWRLPPEARRRTAAGRQTRANKPSHGLGGASRSCVGQDAAGSLGT